MPDDGLGGDLDPVVGIRNAVDADYGDVDNVTDVRLAGELQQPPRTSHIGGPTRERPACR